MKFITTILVAVTMASGPADAFSRRAERVAEGIYVLREAPSMNIAFVVGPRGVAVVNTGLSYREGLDIIAAVRRVTRLPIRIAFVTHVEQAAVFGAAAFQVNGIPVAMHRQAAALMASRCESCLRVLQAELGEKAMAATRVVEPDRFVQPDELVAIGRRLRIIAPPRSSSPGALALFDEQTSTLLAGNLVAIHSVPDMRDADPRAWMNALENLGSTHCRHLVPAYGPVGSCSDISAFSSYLRDLQARVAILMRAGTGLGEIGERCEMPEYARWGRYGELHRANASHSYLRLERAAFDDM